MAAVSSLTIRHHSRNAISVAWGLSFSSDETASEYSLKLYRSESPEGEFDIIMQPSISSSSAIDSSINTISKTRIWYYKLKIFLGNTEIAESLPESIGSTPDVIASEIVRKEKLLLKRKIKTRVYFYLARTFGQRCSKCWVGLRRRNSDADCPVCYGTGFEDGFFDPLEGYINFDPSPQIQQISNWGPLQQSECQCMTTNYPKLKVNDMVIEVSTGKRWTVTQIGYNEKNRYMISQLLRLSELPRSSIVYDIAIPTIWNEPWQ